MRFALIGTFHGRHENSFPLMHRIFVASTRQPDEAWLMCETREDAEALEKALFDLYELDLLDGRPDGLRIVVCPTPRSSAGTYKVIPYSNKINTALAIMDAEAVCYLDNNSMPGPEKYEVMAEGLEEHDDWGAVYVTQKRTGFNTTIALADGPVQDGYCVLNYTQVMHRWTSDRWSLDMNDANPDLADGLYWRALHRTLGPFQAVGGPALHDEHHMASPAAAGL